VGFIATLRQRDRAAGSGKSAVSPIGATSLRDPRASGGRQTDISVASPFLTGEDLTRFAKGPRIPRTIEERRFDGRPGGRLALERPALQELRDFERGTAQGLRCLLIGVHEGDGMSWGAAVVHEALAREAPEIPRISLRPSAAGGLPAITAALSVRTLAEIAARQTISDSYRPRNRIRLIGLLAGLVAASVAVSYVTALLQAATKQPSLDLLARPTFLLPAAILPLLGLLVAMLTPSLTGGKVKPKELAEDIEAAARDLTREHDAFAASVAKRLGQPTMRERLRKRRARLVVVDDYDRLDTTTKSVISSYFAHAELAERTFELWVVFESLELDELRKQLVVEREDHASYRLNSCAQLLLDKDQRRRLAELVGHPERGDLVTVKAISRSPSLDDEELERFCQEQPLATPPREGTYGPLELFYLLALAFTSGGGFVRVGQIESRLAGGNYRGDVLRAFMHGAAPKKNELFGRFTEMRREFARFLAEGDGFFRVAPEAGRVLAKHSHELALPDARLGHLFWALYWLDYEDEFTSQGWWRRKLASHVIAAASPSVLGVAFNPQVDERFFVAAVRAAERCLEACLLDDVPRLLERALELTDPDDAELWRSRSSRLRRTAWDAFGVLGSDDVLGVTLRLESWRARDGDDRPSGSAHVLERLFFESSKVAREESHHTLDLVIGRSSANDAFRSYSAVRGAWFALTLEPFARSVPGRLANAAALAPKELVALTEGALDRLGRAERRAVDLEAASLGLWCCTLGLANRFRETLLPDGADRLLGLLETASIVALELASTEGPRPGGGKYELLSEALTRELTVVVAACTLLVNRARAELGDLFTSGERLDRLLGDSRELLSAPGRPISDSGELARSVAGEMNLLVLMWNALGLPQLGSFMSLRRGHFHVLTRRDEPPQVYTETLKALASELADEGPIGLLAHTIAAESSARGSEIATTLLLNGIERAVHEGVSDELAVELSLVAIANGGPHGFPSDGFAEHLVGVGDGPNPLADVLAALPDADVRLLTIPLVNTARSVERPGLARRIIEPLSTRATAMKDESAADHALESVQLYEVETAVAAGDAIDLKALLETWERRRGKPSYAWLIKVLLESKAVPAEDLLIEATDLLKAEREGRFSSLDYVPLALALARRAPDSVRATSAATMYLRAAMGRYENQLKISTNIAAYRILQRHIEDPAANARLAYWEVQMHEHDRLKKLPSLVASGRFFILCMHCYDELEHWDLPVALEPNGVLSDAGDAPSAGQLVERWQAEGGRIPPPMIENGSTALSLDFLRIGAALFGELERDESFQEARERFDQAAKQALRPLYQLVTAEGSIPAPIRSVLRRHQEFVTTQVRPLDGA
jgi:hypothetical protein